MLVLIHHDARKNSSLHDACACHTVARHNHHCSNHVPFWVPRGFTCTPVETISGSHVVFGQMRKKAQAASCQ